LGVNATRSLSIRCSVTTSCFNGHPPLGVNATLEMLILFAYAALDGFNGHPPLGVNATRANTRFGRTAICTQFQWAPTLGGECYSQHRLVEACEPLSFNRHPPLGVNATSGATNSDAAETKSVSMGTHPWG